MFFMIMRFTMIDTVCVTANGLVIQVDSFYSSFVHQNVLGNS